MSALHSEMLEHFRMCEVRRGEPVEVPHSVFLRWIELACAEPSSPIPGAVVELLADTRRLIRDLRGELPPAVSGTVETAQCPVCRLVRPVEDVAASGGVCACGYQFTGS